LRDVDPEGFASCVVRLELLEQLGHELRRPAADYLHGGLHELRARHEHVQYRLIYFFHGRGVAVVAHGIVKKGSAVPYADVKRAEARKRAFEAYPEGHTFEGEV
jgi:phage-related protein